MSQRLRDRVALVLGAGSAGPGWGNGKAAAHAYVRDGAQLVAVDILRDRAQECVDGIRGQHPDAQCLALAADVTRLSELSLVVDEALRRFGRIDILHYNVGLGAFGGIEDTSEEKWDAIFDINMKGAFLACKLVLPLMEKQAAGVITMISSIASIGIGAYPFVAYQASKAALNHFTRALAVSVACHGIRANAILPGLIDTPLLYGHKRMIEQYGSVEKMIQNRHATSPTGRMGTAWDIANAAAFLASDDAKYINGVILPVDGGLSCRTP